MIIFNKFCILLLYFLSTTCRNIKILAIVFNNFWNTWQQPLIRSGNSHLAIPWRQQTHFQTHIMVFLIRQKPKQIDHKINFTTKANPSCVDILCMLSWRYNPYNVINPYSLGIVKYLIQIVTKLWHMVWESHGKNAKC